MAMAMGMITLGLWLSPLRGCGAGRRPRAGDPRARLDDTNRWGVSGATIKLLDREGRRDRRPQGIPGGMLSVDPESVEAMAVLVPIEAAILFGRLGEAGALVIRTRRRGC